MKYIVTPSECTGSIKAPPSKSYLQRALMLASYAGGKTTIKGYGPNEDTEVIINAIAEMGAVVDINGDVITVTGSRPGGKELLFHCNESGLAARMLSVVSLLTDKKVTVTGSGSLMGRPMKMVAETLSMFGKNVDSVNGCLPLVISGKPVAGQIMTDASQTSQLLSGLLLSLPVAEFDSTVFVSDLKSRPYVELTLELIEKFGLKVGNDDLSRFVIRGKQIPVAADIVAEGDWSGAAFHLVAAAISGEVTVTGLNPYSKQADRIIVDVLKTCGALCEYSDAGLKVKKDKLIAFDFDASNCPDLFPPLAVLAANCNGFSCIKGVGRLFFKESNRAEAIREEFMKMGVNVTFLEDSMFVNGGIINGANVSSHNDHRIAMALAVMGLSATSPVCIDGMECIRKSYPGFICDFEGLSR